MANDREIRRRIKSVKNIAQVTKAMEAVSASKMRRAQAQVLATRPYAEKAWEMLSFLARIRRSGADQQPLLLERPEQRILLRIPHTPWAVPVPDRILLGRPNGPAGTYRTGRGRPAAQNYRSSQQRCGLRFQSALIR